MLLLSLLQAACLLQLPLLLGYLEAVNLDQILLDEALLRQELQHILALVALQLDDLAELRVIHNGTVAAELFLECLQHLLVVIRLLEALNGG
jgi:hypothetical protein